MKNRELILLKSALYAMRFESYGLLKTVGGVESQLDSALKTYEARYSAVLEGHGVKQEDITKGHPLISVIEKEMKAIGEEEVVLDVAFLSEDQFNNAISVQGGIPTELLIVASKYLVK